MAITTLQNPDIISPTYSPMFYLNSSNYSTELGFKYSYDLYDSSGLIASKKVIPFPNDYGRIDVSNLLKNYLSYDLSYNSTGVTDSLLSIKQYDTYIGYTGSTHTQSPATSGIRYAFNGVSNDDFSFNNYVLSATTSKFLTHSPVDIDIFLTDYYTMGFFNGFFSGYTSSANYIYIKVYGTSVRTYRLTNSDYNYSPATGLTNVDKMIKQVGVGPMNLNVSTSYDVDLSGATTNPIITTDTTRYEVYTTNSGLSRTSLIYTFTINKNPSRYGKDQLAFLNRLGQFSYFTFIGKTIETTKQVQNTYLKNRYYLNGTNWTTDISTRGTTIYNTDTNTEYIFQSDYINQDTFTFMEELFTSPEVYYLSQLGSIPLIVLDTDWVNKKTINDKMINFSLKCGVSNKKKINI